MTTTGDHNVLRPKLNDCEDALRKSDRDLVKLRKTLNLLVDDIADEFIPGFTAGGWPVLKDPEIVEYDRRLLQRLKDAGVDVPVHGIDEIFHRRGPAT